MNDDDDNSSNSDNSDNSKKENKGEKGARHIRCTVGARFGRLTLRQRTRPKNGKRRWLVDCECGTRLVVPEHYLKRPEHPKRNCGACPDLKSSVVKHNREYHIWRMMQFRCSNPTHVSYAHYGGRGIRVAEEWTDPAEGFKRFLAHVGPRPSPAHTIDRIDNDGPYAPGNVRWATPEQQAANRSHSTLDPSKKKKSES